MLVDCILFCLGVELDIEIWIVLLTSCVHFNHILRSPILTAIKQPNSIGKTMSKHKKVSGVCLVEMGTPCRFRCLGRDASDN